MIPLSANYAISFQNYLPPPVLKLKLISLLVYYLGFGGFGAATSTAQQPAATGFGGFGGATAPAASAGFGGLSVNTGAAKPGIFVFNVLPFFYVFYDFIHSFLFMSFSYRYLF